MRKLYITVHAGATITRANPTQLAWLNTHKLAVPYATEATKWENGAETVYEFTWLGQPWIVSIEDVTEGIAGTLTA